jgi:phage terminase small subunit
VSVLAERAAAELRRHTIIDGKPSPWVTVQSKAIRAMVALAMRLRLSPQSRAPTTPRKVGEPLSAYEMMDITHDRE